MKRSYQRVIDAERLWAKGAGWWEITLACGHRVVVLHGAQTPVDEYAQCWYHCGDGPPPRREAPPG